MQKLDTKNLKLEQKLFFFLHHVSNNPEQYFRKDKEFNQSNEEVAKEKDACS